MSISFCKFHGFGNDYIVIERDNIPPELDQVDLALGICQRHTGAGSDGVAIVEKLDESEADFFCEIVNPDGSVAGFSGNGTRCAVSYIYYKNLWKKPKLRLETRSGVKHYRLIEEESRGHYWFEAEIGKPKFSSAEVPVSSPSILETVIDFPVSASSKEFLVSGVNVGNPVACIFVDEFDPMWRVYGRTLERNSAFPERANIVFVKVIDRENIELKIWERGAGETSSSGTCVSGSAALTALTGRTGRKVSVHTEGGTTEFLWRDDDEMLIVGRADLAFCGEWSP
ncbi:MAG: diaminopimelate epimerase [Pyrinomonadaceae bacterium]